MMLGDLGARVIKVESPGSGDDTRGWGPPFVQPRRGDRESTYFLSTNKNKESITLDLKDDADKAVLTELLRRADVLMENFRPGTLARLGFGTDVLAELNPRLVTLAISGFGHDGPEGGRAGYDQIAQGEGGLMSLTGSGPGRPAARRRPDRRPAGRHVRRLRRARRALERERTGRGQVVRTSLLAAIVGVHAFQGTAWTVAGKVGRAQGNHHPSIVPYGLFHCAGGSVQLSCGSRGAVAALRRVRASTRTPRHGHQRRAGREPRAGHRLLEAAFADISAEDLLARLANAGIPAGKVRTIDEVYAWDQALSQGLLVDVEHATLGRVSLPGPPLRFFDAGSGRRDRDHPARALRSPRCSAPTATRSAPGCPAPAACAARRDDVEDGHAT